MSVCRDKHSGVCYHYTYPRFQRRGGRQIDRQDDLTDRVTAIGSCLDLTASRILVDRCQLRVAVDLGLQHSASMLLCAGRRSVLIIEKQSSGPNIIPSIQRVVVGSARVARLLAIPPISGPFPQIMTSMILIMKLSLTTLCKIYSFPSLFGYMPMSAYIVRTLRAIFLSFIGPVVHY